MRGDLLGGQGMKVEEDKLARICGDIKAHQEHSDIVYLHYFNSLIAISTAIIGSSAFLTLKLIESNQDVIYLIFVFISACFGLYTCHIYNHYLQNEKQSQKYLIDIFDFIKSDHPNSSDSLSQ